jgi:hypothetical protein
MDGVGTRETGTEIGAMGVGGATVGARERRGGSVEGLSGRVVGKADGGCRNIDVGEGVETTIGAALGSVTVASVASGCRISRIAS